MSNYLETNDEKFAIQIGNFGSKLGGYQTLFGLAENEVTGAQEDAAYFQWIVSNVEKVDTYKRNWTSFKSIAKKGATNITNNTVPNVAVLDAMPREVAPGVQFRFTTLVNRIKAHQNYTVAIGQNLGIELSTTQKLDLDAAQPTLKIVIRAGKVNLDWKKGKFDGIVIEKDSGTGFVMLDKDLHPNFIDNSPLPPQGESAIWKYRAMYLYSDNQVGFWSDVVTTSVSG
jgi:hypothetical protein